MRGGNHMDNQLPELKVNMLGRFSITYGEQPITFKRNSATKAVKLLQILLHSSLVEDRGSTGIPRAQLLDDLFGREELANVGNNLRVTVFRLRKMLIEAGLPEYEYIVKEKGVFYWRSPMNEYSCAMKSHFRKFGNQMSGSGNHLCNYASLLA